MQNLPDINYQLSGKDLFDAFKLQLAKDFEQSNFPSAFAADLEPDYRGIVEKIAHEIQLNEKRTDFNVIQILYRIDISETQLKKYLTKYENDSYYNVLAELIIKRVLQKVVTKQHYKAN